ncbi:DUF4326 domain-containing protein [Microbacterium aerolatum]|uniref:DUF4326 domain-containing protein n=1 Tax=Microbacterium aerolatum TaxID=153731 RepID=UPI003851332D
MSAPKRIQLSRRKGWRKPENTIVVARPSKWGNPWRVGRSPLSGHLLGCHDSMRSAREHVVELFEMHIGPLGLYEYDADTLARLRTELAGKNLACWCPLDQPCHADVLLELANGEAS